MLNQAKPASLSGSNSSRTLVLLLPSSNPPPWIRMAAANGPGPSGTCRSSSNGWPPGRAYSTSFLSRGAAARVAAQAIARMKAGVRMEDDCTRGGTGLLACPSSCYKCVVSYYERHLPHWQPEGAALFLTWRLARIAPENRAELGSPWVKLFQQIRAGQWFRYFTGAEDQTWDRPPGLSSSCYKCVVSYYERHLPHWQPEGAALFLTWRLARIAPENRADLGSPWVKLF